MSDHFDPRRIQADYLRASGFRDQLAVAASFSENTEIENVGTDRRWLRDMTHRLVSPWPSDRLLAYTNLAINRDDPWTRRFANAIIAIYELGDRV